MKLLFALLLVAGSSAWADISLNGTWKSECVPFGKNNRHGFIALLTFETSKLDVNFKMFADNQCSHENLVMKYEGAYASKNSDLDHIPNKVEMTILDQNVLDFYNANKGCGITGWKLIHAQSVSGRYCHPFQMPHKGKMFYDRYFRDGDKIQFGLIPLRWVTNTPKDRPDTALGVEFSKIH
jgi:hypothetical protein